MYLCALSCPLGVLAAIPRSRRALLHTAFFCAEAAAVASADAIFRLISPFGSKARTIVSVPEECITLFKNSNSSYFVSFYLCLSLHKDLCTAWPSFYGKLLYSEGDSWSFRSQCTSTQILGILKSHFILIQIRFHGHFL